MTTIDRSTDLETADASALAAAARSRRVSGGLPRLDHHAMIANKGKANNMRYMMSVTASTP